MQSYDAIVIGAGVIGSSVAYHLARFGARNVLVLDRTQIGAGTTTQSSGILRTHYSVIENVELALASRGGVHGLRRLPGRRRGLGRAGQVRLPDRAPEGPRLDPLRQRWPASAARASRCSFSTPRRPAPAAHRPLRRRGADRLRARGGLCRRLPHRPPALRAPRAVPA
jgi:glycine/D-amino acid oxidase-like deaminating enzyme